MSTRSTSNHTTITDILNEIYKSSRDCDEVSIGDILEMVGRRSFGPIIFIAGIITLAPIIGDIPGVPTIMATIVFLAAVQLIIGRKTLWLPDLILKRSVKSDKLHSAINKLEKPAKYIERFIKPRFNFMTNGTMTYPIAVICLCIALATPFMEFIPFSANFAGAALTAFGLSIIAKDGLLAMIGYVFTISIVGFIIFMVA